MLTQTQAKKIRRLAAKKGTPLVAVNYYGNAVVFLYKEGLSTKGYSYAMLNKGVQGEIKRLTV